MSLFRNTNPADVIRYTHENGEDWIELRSDFSKREVTTLYKRNRAVDEKDLEGALNFQEEFFALAAAAWSAGPGTPKKSEYLDMPWEGAKWVDEILGQHFKATIGREVADDEKKPTS